MWSIASSGPQSWLGWVLLHLMAGCVLLALAFPGCMSPGSAEFFGEATGHHVLITGNVSVYMDGDL